MHWYKTILVPVAQWIACWTSNPKVLGSDPSWDDIVICLNIFYLAWLDKKQFLWPEIEPMPYGESQILLILALVGQSYRLNMLSVMN